MVVQEVKAAESPCLNDSCVTVGLAIRGSKSSKHVVEWALRNFRTKEKARFILIHVMSNVTTVPTPMGNYIPIDKVRSDVANAYEKDVERKAQEMLLFYKKMCDKKKIESEVLVIKGDDVAEIISNAVSTYQISKLVVGISSRSTFVRKYKGNKTSSRICKSVPSFCTTYVASKGGLSSIYSPRSESDRISDLLRMSDKSSNNEGHSGARSSRSDFDDNSEWKTFDFPSSPQASPRNQSFSPSNCSRLSFDWPEDAAITPSRSFRHNFSWENINNSSSANNNRSLSIHENLTASTSVSINDKNRSTTACARGGSFGTSKLLICNEVPTTSSPHQGLVLSENKDDISSKLEKLRLELKHIQGVYKLVQDESVGATQQMIELAARRMSEENRLREVHSRLDTAANTVQQVKDERHATEKQAMQVREIVRQEDLLKQILQVRASSDADKRQRLEKLLVLDGKTYSTFTWDEMESATSSFSDALKIGAGANGTVYKGNLHHTIVAIKLLHSDDSHKTKQFNQELEILGKIRHPHLLLLLGACPDRGCLVYEYMENGSLNDRLQCKGGTPPVPWFHRCRIAWEIASSLVFLHSAKPDPIIHRDLKPANILLDGKFVSKIGDVGLSTLLPFRDALWTRTIYKETGLVGTLFYMDPEYQRTGLVSTKSDTYALGMVILQLLTARPPAGLPDLVERALEDNRLTEILDRRAGRWPKQEAHDLAHLGLSCLEMRSKDRPDLKCKVLAELERLNRIASAVCDPAQLVPTTPPCHFICPILKRVMLDPCIASDGYSYDRNAIEMWLCENDVSPLTKLPFPNKDLVPNHSLLRAITSWKAE